MSRGGILNPRVWIRVRVRVGLRVNKLRVNKIKNKYIKYKNYKLKCLQLINQQMSVCDYDVRIPGHTVMKTPHVLSLDQLLVLLEMTDSESEG